MARQAMPRLGILAERMRLRIARQRLILRARRGRRGLLAVVDRTARIADRDILCFVTLRNERPRLSFFLDYYRALGVRHFLVVDNASTDGGGDVLQAQSDVSV